MDNCGISYHLIRSNRRTIAIQIRPDGQVLVRCGQRTPEKAVRCFVQSKAGWIEKQLARLTVVPKLTDIEILELKQQAKDVLTQRVAYFAPLVGVTYGSVTIRAQHTRWGSCSGKGNLSFNCLLMLVPPEVLDYVVIHELCHRKEMNHSRRFWTEVACVLPNYRESKKWLKDNGQALIGRLGKQRRNSIY